MPLREGLLEWDCSARALTERFIFIIKLLLPEGRFIAPESQKGNHHQSNKAFVCWRWYVLLSYRDARYILISMKNDSLLNTDQAS
jgi:hypothetical protein